MALIRFFLLCYCVQVSAVNQQVKDNIKILLINDKKEEALTYISHLIDKSYKEEHEEVLDDYKEGDLTEGVSEDLIFYYALMADLHINSYDDYKEPYNLDKARYYSSLSLKNKYKTNDMEKIQKRVNNYTKTYTNRLYFQYTYNIWQSSFALSTSPITNVYSNNYSHEFGLQYDTWIKEIPISANLRLGFGSAQATNETNGAIDYSQNAPVVSYGINVNYRYEAKKIDFYTGIGLFHQSTDVDEPDNYYFEGKDQVNYGLNISARLKYFKWMNPVISVQIMNEIEVYSFGVIFDL